MNPKKDLYAFSYYEREIQSEARLHTLRHCQMWTFQPSSTQSVYILTLSLSLSLHLFFLCFHFSILFHVCSLTMFVSFLVSVVAAAAVAAVGGGGAWFCCYWCCWKSLLGVCTVQCLNENMLWHTVDGARCIIRMCTFMHKHTLR